MNEESKKTTPKIEKSELGQFSIYDHQYNPERLCAIPRADKREEIGIDPNKLPFFGFDCWNHYEVSWLNEKGKPIVAVAEIIYDCRTTYLIESKSLKLYFNSFNNMRYESAEEVKHIVERDLSLRLRGSVRVDIRSLADHTLLSVHQGPGGECIDELDVHCSVYHVQPSYLATTEEWVEEVLYSDLLKSNCLVTNQPDWGTIQIAYEGKKIIREGLLQYFVSFRNHNEFHEQCVERIFVDIMTQCRPKKLTVYGRYTRRGGLDINPYRTTENIWSDQLNLRLSRQ